MNAYLTPKQRPTIMGCGLVAWDVVVDEGRAVSYTGVGGTVGNVLAIMAGLGWRSVPLVRLGADAAGRRVLEELISLGVDTSRLAIDRKVRTPVIYQVNNPDHHSFSFSCPICGTSHRFQSNSIERLEATEPSALCGGSLFFFDRLSDSAVELAEQTRSNGGLVVFEPSTVSDEESLLRRALSAAHVVKYSAERLPGFDSSMLREGFVEIQTRGARGLRFRMHSIDPSWVELPAIRSHSVIDTAGAGDWCTAGFLHLLGANMQGGSLSDLGYNHVHMALRGGQAVAALNCQHVGSRGLMRWWNPASLLQMLDTIRVHSAGDLYGADWADTLQQLGERFLDAQRTMLGQPPTEARRDLCCRTLLGPETGATGLQ